MSTRRSANGPGGRTARVDPPLSPATLREFQRAAEIRDAFFPTGGNMPIGHARGDAAVGRGAGRERAKLEINGVSVASQPASRRSRRATRHGGPAADHDQAGSRCNGPARFFAHRHIGRRRARSAIGARANRAVVAVPHARGRLARRAGRQRRSPASSSAAASCATSSASGSLRNPLNSAGAARISLPRRDLKVSDALRPLRKAAAKRDFIAVGAPRAFLDVWEPWMQGGISASRHSLGEAWQERLPDRADLALLARRGDLRHHGARRLHAVARRRRPLLSADAVRLRRRRRWRSRRRRSTRRTTGSRPPRISCLSTLDQDAAFETDHRRARATCASRHATVDAPAGRHVADHGGAVAAPRRRRRLVRGVRVAARRQSRQRLRGGELLVDDRRRRLCAARRCAAGACPTRSLFRPAC